MVCRKKEKIFALTSTLVILVLSFFDLDIQMVGATSDGGFTPRLLYSFFHANIFHTIINLWCWLSIVFYYEPSWIRMVYAYAIAVLAPSFTLATTPTIGLSAFLFALLGFTFYDVQRKLYYTYWMAFYIIVGLLIPNINGLIHLYSYLAGLMVGLFTTPLCRK